MSEKTRSEETRTPAIASEMVHKQYIETAAQTLILQLQMYNEESIKDTATRRMNHSK
jgi:hypothetical protein